MKDQRQARAAGRTDAQTDGGTRGRTGTAGPEGEARADEQASGTSERAAERASERPSPLSNKRYENTPANCKTRFRALQKLLQLAYARPVLLCKPSSNQSPTRPAARSDLELCLVQCKNANTTPPSKKLKSTAVPRGFYGTRPTCTNGSDRSDLNCYLSDGLRSREAPPTSNKTRPAEALTGSAVLATRPAQIATSNARDHCSFPGLQSNCDLSFPETLPPEINMKIRKYT